ncbi:MAG: hypothetical protein ACK5PB_00730 [Pirellula sp.]|jgi:uncharacterized membrane protein
MKPLFLCFASIVSLVFCETRLFADNSPSSDGNALNSARAKDFPTKTIKVGDLELEIVVNSDTFSQASAINSQGSIVGTREVIGQNAGIISQRSFYFGAHGHKDMPIPETYTNVEVTGISDTDLVIGYAARPIGHPKGNLDGVVWEPETDEITVLPRAEGDSACHAQSVSSDGTIITGYSTGPARLRPVVWMKSKETGLWVVTVLPTVHENNPYLMSSSVRITPDGTCIAGCCTEAFMPNNVIDSSLYLWTKNDQGEWFQRSISEKQMQIKGINNERQIVGVIRELTGKTYPCLFNEKGEETRLSLLEGDETGEARGINQKSVIVGFSDDPPGPEGGPEPCRWGVDGNVVSVPLGASPYGAIHGINDSGQMAGMATLTELVSEPGVENGLTVERVLAFRTKKSPR